MGKTMSAFTAVGAAGALLFTSGPVVAQALYDWNGAYFGVTGGVVLSEVNLPFSYPEGTLPPDPNSVYFIDGVPLFSSLGPPVDAVAFPASAALGETADILTFGAGFDLQQGSFVYGLATDVSFLAGSPSTWTTGTVTDTTNGRTHEVTVSGEVSMLASVRARLGVGVDRLLLFGTGGIAAGHADLETGAYLDQGYGAADWAGTSAGWSLGYVLGAGAEYAVTDNLSLKIEGLYYGLGTMTTTAAGEGTFDDTFSAGTPLDVAPYAVSMRLDKAVVQAGLNVRF